MSGKGARKVPFEGFLKALELAADVKGIPVQKLHNKLLNASGPSSSGTKAQSDNVLSRLTDTSKVGNISSSILIWPQYTGSHKERFDETGKGKGKDGRVDKDKVQDISQILDRSAADVRGRTFESTVPGPV